MKSTSSRLRTGTLAAAALYALLAAAPRAQAVSLSELPLFLSSAVDPNVFFEVDDSGSMDWEILTVQHWHSCAYTDDSSPPCGWLDDGGRWQGNTGGSNYETFEYIFNNDEGDAYTIGCTSGRESLYECDDDLTANIPYQMDWRILSSDMNTLYYDPTQDYGPWQGVCVPGSADQAGGMCQDALFDAARSNPHASQSAAYAETRDLDGFHYEVWEDDKGFSAADARPLPGNVTDGANGLIDLWDSHTRYSVVNGSSIKVERIEYAPDDSGLNPEITLVGTFSGTISFPDGTSRTVAAELRNIANWYQYGRKRAFVAKGAIANVMNNHQNFRYGLSVINQCEDLFVEVPDQSVDDLVSHNARLLGDAGDSLFAYEWSPRITPLRQGLETVGRYFDSAFDNTDLDCGLQDDVDPIINQCQKNFTVLLTDGYWNGDDPGAVIGNADGDPYAPTLADVAKYYYDKDLDTGLPNVIPPGSDNFDLARHQHMVSFTVAFGVEGNLEDTDGDAWPDPALTDSSDWGDPFCSNDCPEKIDDLWHAAWNSRGAYISAKTRKAVVEKLEKALQEIERRNQSAASAASSSGSIQSGTLLFQAQFSSSDWHGRLLALPVNEDGTLGTVPKADAGQQLPGWNNRTILTFDPDKESGAGAGTAFRWDALEEDGTLQGALNRDSAGITDTRGATRLEYLRGNDALEGSDPASNFRPRTNSKLGDIINSAPLYVGAPAFRYPDSWADGGPESGYSEFIEARQNRTPMVYVGANDGMLHGFKATGTSDLLVERIAYVPAAVYDNLSRLTDPAYAHRFYVDGTPTWGDVYYNGAWHSVLAAGLNLGGQGIYALDITNPAAFSESSGASMSPADTVLWEFTDADDTDLGFTYSRPAVVRMQNRRWAAVFGNGYNNTLADGNASTTGTAVLYIVDIETGELIRKLDTGVGDTVNPNGLATAAPVDVDGDSVVDFIYAGDLRGNLWKFDVSNTGKGSWKIAFGGKPLFVATGAGGSPQPVTSRPEVGRGPFGQDLMVYFGTGKYLGSPDNADKSQQSFYAIIDDSESPVTSRSDLLEQTVTFQNDQVRVVSDSAITRNQKGWFLDLPDPEGLDTGERVVSAPMLVAGRIIFTTIVPDVNECSGGGYSWLMELDARNGGVLDQSPFDLNSDKVFSVEDLIDTDDDGLPDTAAGGIKPGPGISPAPVRIVGKDTEHKYMPSTTGAMEHIVENPGQGFIGRQSWRQAR